MVYDLTYVYDYDLSDPFQAAAAYDHLHLVAALQGIVNRDAPRLYTRFVTRDEFGDEDLDGYWFNKLRAPGEMLSGRPLHRARDLNELIHLFRRYIRGAVVWDTHVYSTSNVAMTVAGANNLLPFRYDLSSDSLYRQFVASPAKDMDLPAKVWLIHRDRSPLFTGSGTIPGTSAPSSGSPKCDAYLWVKSKYLDAGRCTGSELGFYLDSYWLMNPQGKTQQTVLTNLDYMVSRKGFVFDLSPWGDEQPVDAPSQPLGTDLSTLQTILLSAYQQTQGGMVAVHGFVPWGNKYTNAAPSGGRHAPVETGWQFVKVASAYNAYLDADAENLDAMANASVYQHYPLQPTYEQNPKPQLDDLKSRGFIADDGSVVARRYSMFYVGDYDSAAWLYHAGPRLWDDPRRGLVPLNWAFNPNLAQRMSPALVYTRATRTPNDYFIAGDSGAGYVNPGMLQEPRQYSGLPSGLDAWQAHCQRYFKQWDLSVTGFVIDGAAPGMNQQALETYARFSPDGFAAQKIEPRGLIGNTAYVQMDRDLPRASASEGAYALESALDGDTSKTPFAPEFHSFRTIQEGPGWHKDVVDQVRNDLPNAEVKFVDAYTFYTLLKLYLKEVILDPIKTTLAVGQTSTIVLDLVTYAEDPVEVGLQLELPNGWNYTPQQAEFTLQSGVTQRLSFEVTVPQDTNTDIYTVSAVIRYKGLERHRKFAVTVAQNSYANATEVGVTLGATNQSNGRTAADTVDGRECRRPVFTGSEFSYFYLLVDDTFMYDERGTTAYATVEYYDAPNQALGIHYDSNNPSGGLNGAYTDAGSVNTAGTNTWTSYTFTLPDVRFANRENGGADLRIYTNDNIAVSEVTVSRDAHA